MFVGLLREKRELAGVTQVELSKALGRSQSFVSDLERGQRRLDVIELRDICKCLKVDFSGFIAGLERRLRPSTAPPARRRNRTERDNP